MKLSADNSTGLSKAHTIRGIRERIAVTLQCGNADAIRAWARGCFKAATIAARA
jgi:hypothetical protein